MRAGDRIAQERIAQGLTQDQLASMVKRLGGSISQTGIDKMEKRGSERPRFLAEIAQALNVTEEWLLFGREPKLRPPTNLIVPVPIITWVSAGSLSEAEHIDEEKGILAVSNLNPRGKWFALEVKGDSMDRISPNGSIILVDYNDKQLVPNACYIISNERGSATYKRYRPTPQRFEPVSTNPTYETIFDGNISVVGRVRRSILDM